ncbi:hypothetical protein CC85DRAFT_62497 [Cutaneotrichosporon oleaginosum]|uniref:BRCT domain-containing protein n=1 Tax=Cutaneotrichosporon oleaginosum TaxID=879819 RepID=A0A0J1B6I1_9TREE|nr:uncharacterized protein CC85DRAFT_62497 [Cutaneotrichosporon oleaginosum]KLT43339.1 hypothetical protein CC85DRAFT_62497 [Cutaneotrichosporon oleaginosum]TXT14399.1 hypothetical protein COLE_00592 [Cutaneotrichosporon oleaginosum]
MNRRGHLSKKVSGVKIRPNTRRHSALPLDGDEIVRSAWDEAHEDEGEDDAPIEAANASRPWNGISITFTGVADKPELSKQVRALGGRIESALTVSTTHVVAPGFGSAKYLYAIEHGIPVLSPSWINDAHQRWLNGETLDVPASVEAHRLQPFIGLKIAISGIEQMDRRKRVIQLIKENGGIYSKDLDRSCTHLVSAHNALDKSKQSEKIKWALKEQGDRDAGRRRGRRYDDEDQAIVYEEWLWDCVGYRGRWPEKDYDARKPRGKGKVTPEEVMDGSVYERLRPPPPVPVDEDQPIVVRKDKRGTRDSLVGELLSVSNIPVPEVRAPEAEVEPAAKVEEAVEEALPSRAGDVFERKESRLHASRTGAFDAGPSRTSPPADASRVAEKRLFAGLRFSHTIESAEVLEKAIRMRGGAWVSEAERLRGAEVDYVIIRLGSTAPAPAADGPQPVVVTECWVEACIYEKALLAPERNVIFRPLPFTTPLEGAGAIVAHVSGFKTDQAVYLRRMLKAAGIEVSKALARGKITHVVLAAPEGRKFESARQWGLAIVKPSWVWTMAHEGRIDPVEQHVFGPDAEAPRNISKTDSTSSEEPILARTVASTDSILGRQPPLSATERVLNNATRSPSRSLPASPGKPAPPPTVDDDVTAQLRRLAEANAPRAVLPTRRSLPSRPTISTSSGPTASPAPPIDLEVHPLPREDESMRVTYADPASEKEKRKLVDQVLRGADGKRRRV